MKRKVRAWAVVIKSNNELCFGQYSNFAVFPNKFVAKSYLAEIFKDNARRRIYKIIPCTMTYELPKKKKAEGNVGKLKRWEVTMEYLWSFLISSLLLFCFDGNFFKVVCLLSAVFIAGWRLKK